MACKGFTVSYAGTYTNVAMQSVPAKVLNVFGHFDLTAFNNSKLSISNWKGDIVFNPANISTLNVLTGGKTLVLNSITIPGNTTTYTVNFNDSLFLDRTTTNAAIINLGSGYTTTNAVIVNFNELLKMGSINGFPGASNTHASLNVISGIANFNNGIFSNLLVIAYQNCNFSTSGGINQGGLMISNSSSVTLSPQTFTSVGYPIARNRSVIGFLQVNGTTAVNAPTLSVVGQTLQVNGFLNTSFANTSYVNSVINVNMYGQRNGYAGMFEITGTTTLSAAGSTINILPNGLNAGQFQGGALILSPNLAFNVFNIHDHCVNVFCSGVQTFNQLNFVNLDKQFTNYGSATTFSINPGGSMFVAPGTSLQSFVSTFRYAPTSTLTMLGTCGHDITLSSTTFSFGTLPLSNINVDRVLLNSCTAIGTAALYPAGVNSRFAYGTTNTGWNVNCTPPARTLFWQGPLAGGNWSDPNNWSLNPLASPSSTQTPISVGSCEPTENDSVVFPPLSNVFLNKITHYSNSVNIISTATIVATNGPITGPSGAPIRYWVVSGGWWATNKFYNNFNGTVYFNTYKNFRCIKTGGVPFKNNIQFVANTPPNLSCVPITTVTSGGWLILDSLYTNSIMNITKGNFKTYDPNPIFSSYYPPAQKLGSTLYSANLQISYLAPPLDTVKFFDSDVYISSAGNSLQLTRPNTLFNEGTAEFIISGPNGYSNNTYMSTYGNKIDELTSRTFSVITNASFNQTRIQNIAQTNLGANVILNMDMDTINRVNNFQNLQIATSSSMEL